jgi:hypothetical protein
MSVNHLTSCAMASVEDVIVTREGAGPAFKLDVNRQEIV